MKLKSGGESGNVVHLRDTRKRPPQKAPPFVPLTGNPENGDYEDYVRHLQKGEVITFPRKTKDFP